MTNEQAKKMLKAKLECLKRETSGIDFDCNNNHCDECSLCYEQGNMGEQKQALDIAIRALEMQKKLAEFSGMDICEWVEDYDYDEENTSEYEFEASVDDFLIDEAKEGKE